MSYGFVGATQSTGKSQADRLFARAQADDYMGSNAGCMECHPDKVEHFSESPHAAFMSDPNLPPDKSGCQGCHGPGNIHVADENAEVISFTKMSPKESSAACLRCHEKTMDKNQWHRTDHARADVACVSCHQIHSDTETDLGKKVKSKDPRSALFAAKPDPKSMLKADEETLCGSCHPAVTAEFRGAHRHPVPEGRMVCSDCHSPHPSKANTVRQDALKKNCVTCHTEKAGPFIFEHDPVAGNIGDGCVECHRPHGTNNPRLLISVTRGLCAQCHTDKLAGHHPGQTCWNAGCHVATHGSNTDPRFLQH
ncbi:MAG TPA: cytochrome c3 family protein [Fimbriimonadaceae bacterium]|nr:cytochrome c3 family protein [Fimbriimonadaceae bacterium]